jgi:hypothetical protein
MSQEGNLMFASNTVPVTRRVLARSRRLNAGLLALLIVVAFAAVGCPDHVPGGGRPGWPTSAGVSHVDARQSPASVSSAG